MEKYYLMNFKNNMFQFFMKVKKLNKKLQSKKKYIKYPNIITFKIKMTNLKI